MTKLLVTLTCLFASAGHDVLGLVRSGADDAAISSFVTGVWRVRSDRYSDERNSVLAAGMERKKVEMSYIGG